LANRRSMAPIPSGQRGDVDPALPPLQQVKGSLQFSEKDLRVPEINAQLFGGPLRSRVGRRAARCWCSPTARWPSTTAAASNCRCSTRPPVTTTIVPRSGCTSAMSNCPGGLGSGWRRVDPAGAAGQERQRSAAAAFRERRHCRRRRRRAGGQAIVRDQVRATLGNVLSLQVIRRKQGSDASRERGAIMIGGLLPRVARARAQSASLPAHRCRLLAEAPRQRQGRAARPDCRRPARRVDLKADEVVLLGASYTGVSVGGCGSITTLWRGNVNRNRRPAVFSVGRQRAAGKLKAQFRKWRRPEQGEQNDQSPLEALKELPASTSWSMISSSAKRFRTPRGAGAQRRRHLAARQDRPAQPSWQPVRQRPVAAQRGQPDATRLHAGEQRRRQAARPPRLPGACVPAVRA
jgi:hypothetical protein